MSERTFELRPIAFVRSPRIDVADDFWGDVVSEIELCDNVSAESLDEFSHDEIIYAFDRTARDKRLESNIVFATEITENTENSKSLLLLGDLCALGG